MINKYKIYLDIDGETLLLPIPPKENPVKYPTSNKKYNVLGIGDIVVPQSPSLITITVDSYFPGDSSDPLLFGRKWRRPARYVELLEEARETGCIIDAVICRYDATGKSMYDTNIAAIISGFETRDKGGEAGDVYYRLELTEYRDYGPSKIVLPATESAAAETTEAAPTEQGDRAVTTSELYVGVAVIANGEYFNDSYGGKPSRTVSNLSTTVSRIIDDPSRPCPILIGGNLGWIKKESLQVVT